MADRVSAWTDWQADDALVGGPSLLTSMWRRRYLLVVSAVVSFFIGYGLSSIQAPEYKATATVFLTDPADANLFGRDTGDPERHVQQEASRMQSRAVFERAADIAGDDVTPETVASAVDISADALVGIVEVTTSAGSPRAAANLSNAVVAGYEQVSREAGTEMFNSARDVLNGQMTQLQKQANELQEQVSDNPNDVAASGSLAAVQAQLTALRTRLSEIATETAIHGAGIDSVEEARPPGGRSSPRPARDGIVAAMLGVALASAYGYWRASVTQRARRDVSDVLDAPLLAQIPPFKRTGTDPAELIFDVNVLEAYQFLVSSVEYSIPEMARTSILVTSASPREGKTLTSLHLARALAMQGRDVVLVDSSLHTRGLSVLLRADDDAGLAELASGSSLGEVERSYRVSHDLRLSFVAAGQPPQPPTGLLSTSAYRGAIAHVVDAHQVTIIDGDPLLTVADVSTIASQVTGIILVVDASAPHEALVQIRERLRFISTPLLGYVANRASPRAGIGDDGRHGRDGAGADAASRGANGHAAQDVARGATGSVQREASALGGRRLEHWDAE